MSYGLYANGGDAGTKVPTGEIVSGGFRMAPGATPLAVNTWTHLATTYDGTTLRLFVNGVQAGSWPSAARSRPPRVPLKIGGNAIWGEWFQGEIDEVRIYNRALTATEITGDMNTSISAPRHAGAQRARDAYGLRRARADRPELGRRDRQRRRRPLQRPPRHHRRLHTLRRQPDRAADRDELQRLGARTGHLLLQGHRRGLRRQRRPRRERGERGLRSRHDAADGVDHGAGGRRDGERDGRGQRERVRQRHGRGRAVQARRREPRRRGHQRSLLASPGTRSRSRTARTRSARSHATPPATRLPATNVVVTASNTGSPGSSPHGRSTRRAGRRPPTSPATATRHARQRDPRDDGQVQRGALLQRHERLGQRARLRHARPDHRDDARGLGAAGRRRRVAHGDRQGSARQPRLRPVHQHERHLPGRRDLRRRHAAVAERRLDAAGRQLEPRRGHLRRRDAAALRQRHAVGAARGRRLDRRPPARRSTSAATASGASGSTARSTRFASTTAR